MRKLNPSLMIGFSFLYVPILILILYSFNDSDRVQLFTHFSTRWYESLWQNDELIDAALLSFKIAGISATIAVLIGFLAALSLYKLGIFLGRSIFMGALLVPVIIPEIILGLCLLLLFTSLKQSFGLFDERGAMTISIAHITLTLGYVTILILSQFNQGLKQLEEAAMDLGASFFKIVWRIILPQLQTAMISAWLLSFMLSLDDLIIASFVSGPGAKTLPMLIFSKIKFGVSPEINAISVLLILITFTFLSIYLLLNAKKAKQSQ